MLVLGLIKRVFTVPSSSVMSKVTVRVTSAQSLNLQRTQVFELFTAVVQCQCLNKTAAAVAGLKSQTK